MAKIGSQRVSADDAIAFLNRHGAQVEYVPDYRGPDAADVCLQELLTQLEFQPPEQTRVFVHGRWHDTPRRITAYGDAGVGYRYSGSFVAAKPWHQAPALLGERDALTAATGLRPTYVLINLYRDGHDGISAHSDDERDLGPAPTIHSQTFGALRPFRFRRRDAPIGEVPTVTIELAHGSLLSMHHPTNRLWTHEVPKVGGKRPQRIGPRLNLTWRQVRA